jgi:hypothetical protein
MITLNHIKIVVSRVGNKLPWCIRERDRVLLQFCTQFGDLENSVDIIRLSTQ